MIMQRFIWMLVMTRHLVITLTMVKILLIMMATRMEMIRMKQQQRV